MRSHMHASAGSMLRGLHLALYAGASLVLAACGAPSDTPVEVMEGSAGTAQAAAGEELNQPPNPDFIGRVWVSTTPGSARGSILVFLPDRTLLMDSCFETYRLTRWGVAGEHIRWIEESIPIEAEVHLPAKDALRLRIVGQNRVQSYVAADPPYVCPDMPR